MKIGKSCKAKRIYGRIVLDEEGVDFFDDRNACEKGYC